jgi:hypothetical protein
MQAHIIYEALNKALELAATASFICIQFVFSLFSGLLVAEDLLVSGSSIN